MRSCRLQDCLHICLTSKGGGRASCSSGHYPRAKKPRLLLNGLQQCFMYQLQAIGCLLDKTRPNKEQKYRLQSSYYRVPSCAACPASHVIHPNFATSLCILQTCIKQYKHQYLRRSSIRRISDATLYIPQHFSRFVKCLTGPQVN